MKSSAGITLLSALGVVFSSTSEGTVIFQDTFDSGTGDWYKGAETEGTLSNNTGRLSWQENGGALTEVIARQFSTTTLVVGETLRFTFDYTQTGASPGIMRVGLFNFQNTITGNGWNAAPTNIGGSVQGYTTFVRDNSGTGNNARHETGTISAAANHAPLNSGTDIGTLDTTQYDIVQNGTVTYTVVFEISLVAANQMNTHLTFSSSGVTHFDIPASTSTIYNGFNTVAFRVTGGTALLDNATLEVLPIPEPSSVFLSGVALTGFAFSRRGRN